MGHLAPDTVRAWVEKALGEQGLTLIQSLRRSKQRNGFRYDLFVKPEAVARATDLLRRQNHLTGWHVREHIPHAKRVKKDFPRPTVRNERIMASWNVNSTRSKRQELTWFLRRERVAVLALQETLHKSDWWRLRLGDYQVLSSPMNSGKVGERGVALAISPDLVAHETGTRSPFWIWARILHPSFPQGLIVGSVYVIAHEGPERRAMLQGLCKSAQAVSRRHVGSPVIIMGDWNMDGPEVDATLGKWPVPFRRLKCRGSPRTRWRGAGALRDLDHIVVSAGAETQLAHSWVNRVWDLSDHWPICTLPLDKERPTLDSGQPQQPPLRLNRKMVLANAPAIACHNRWDVLATSEATAPEDCAEQFLETSSRVAEDTGVALMPDTQAKPAKRSKLHSMSRKCRKVVEARRKAFARWDRAPLEEKEALWADYSSLKKESKQLLRREQRERWAQFLAQGAERMVSGDWKGAWRWIKTLGQRDNASSSAPQPVKDLEGNLQVDPEAIATAWADHYGALARDDTGHSRDPIHWQGMGKPREEEMQDLDRAISWTELTEAIQAIRAGKAAGKDGLPPEWFKAMAEPLSSAGDNPSSPMGMAFLKVIQAIWQQASIPACWNEAVVVSVPKKGDPTCMDNYRGISLIGVALKVLCTVVTHRMKEALEDRGLLVCEQAGFRSKEECMGQVTALYEVCTRRAALDEPTYAAFIDFRKAYDTVPHEALMRKLWCIGIRGRTLDFIKSLYQNSGVAVRAGGILSRSFPLRKGLRQGCPMSPILFDIFINDILEGLDADGVEVAGVDERKLPGLLFADDVALLAPDVLRLRRLMSRVEAWANKWEMSIGAHKCGVMVFFGDTHLLRQSQWMMQGQEVPVVESYTYLGVEVHNDWDLTKAAANAASRARKALWALRPALGNPMIPMDVKALMLKALVMPVATYGGEVLGMHQARAKSGQAIINQGLKWALAGDVSKGTVVGAAAARAELGLDSLYAVMAGRRARAWVKFRGLRTWISTLLSHPFRHRKATWVSGTSRYLKRLRADKAIEDKSAKGAAHAVTRLAEEQELKRDKTASREFHGKWGFARTNSFLKRALQRPELAHGIRWLARMRTMSVWTGPRAAKANLVPDRWSDMCPSCERECKEDIPHILLECTLHEESRKALIRPLVERFADESPALAREELAVLMLGGQASGVDLGQKWLGKTTQPIVEGDAPFLRVAEFLQGAMPQRMSRLWSDRTPQPARADRSQSSGRTVRNRSTALRQSRSSVPGIQSQSPNGYGRSLRARAGLGGGF